ncbi:TPA: TraM recognition domain-containing protein [Candidatus Scatousia excrementigallinarum]|uniref:TraM recognition domain-containing protein n=1 Tax=Candidatus Scatousia excrementigallinarum TaxID=2840935 RepID=A0A9D1JM40_9BACT|nr:TraM recognition domain-containing protein [Candidatus Scatousia excrementigallinarum]
MESRVTGNYHARFGAGENLEIISKSYLSLFPALRDFDTTISACAGRNIYFTLVIQSYAQLNNVYGKDVAEIILDNLNVKIFLGSNNYDTLQQFSRECGEMTRISPLSALNGSRSEIEHYELETIPLITRSRLSCFEPGECVVLEANCDHVLLSRLERYYLCPEFSSLPMASEHEYTCAVNPFDEKYLFTIKKRSGRRALWD